MANLKLYTRLKKEDFLRLNEYKKKYPTLGENLENVLKSSDSIYMLKLTDVLDINKILLNNESYHILDVYDLYKKFN